MSRLSEMIKKLCLAGMNVARLNFSHGSHEEHKARIERIKKIRKELKKRGINHLKVVYSKEQPSIHITTENKILGSTAFTPPVVGLIMASEIIKDLLSEFGAKNVF